MPNRYDFGHVHLSAGEDNPVARPTSETAFCIAILGDFSGRAHRGLADPKTIGQRRAYLVDRDNFDEVLSSLKVELHLPAQEQAPIVFHFSELDDFHPDRLFEHDVFRRLRQLRDRLQDPSSFPQVAKELGLIKSEMAGMGPPAASSTPVAAPSATRLASGSLLDEMVEQTESRISEDRYTRKPDEVREFARQVAAKYSVSAPDPRGPELIARVDRAIEDAMTALLHHPDFQALEAIWRATYLLVRQLETGARLKLCLFDISQQELATDLSASSNWRDTGIFRLLVEKSVRTPGADPWAVIVGSYRFGAAAADMAALSGILKIAHEAGAPFLAEASPSWLGCSSLQTAAHPRDWHDSEQTHRLAELRRQPEADSAGLACPRFMLRLPYGEKTSPLESFDFEEFRRGPEHEGYLWGNPAFAAALLLGQSFREAGWDMRPGAVSQLDNLPLHLYSTNGQSESKPCAEVLLTDDAVEGILDRGLIPLVSYKGRDSVRLMRFQSIAEPQRPLAGRWHG
ncbi:MAG TPA: type VI secretion system contractile sheath large subunit [Candidatus Dormibacteraeota bacterium]|nr:type VI secretion system contractile sheath large subunit [Candidatus Dormibacteraeota bacterium]